MAPLSQPTDAISLDPNPCLLGQPKMSPDVAKCGLAGRAAPGCEARARLRVSPGGHAGTGTPSPLLLRPRASLGPISVLHNEPDRDPFPPSQGPEEQAPVATRKHKHFAAFPSLNGMPRTGNNSREYLFCVSPLVARKLWTRTLHLLVHVLWEVALATFSQNRQTKKSPRQLKILLTVQI